jgi:phage protein D
MGQNETGKDLTDLINLEKKYGNFYAPNFLIEIDDKDIKSYGAEVNSVTVDNVLDNADAFNFSVNNPYDPSNNEFKWLSGGNFEVGKNVTIKMGYGSNLEMMILGIITAIKYSFPAGGASQIEVSGYDLSHLMMKGKKSGSWDKKKDSDVISTIASSYGLSPSEVQDSVITQPKIKQDKESDFDFVKKLADRNGFEFFVFEKQLCFRPPEIKSESVVNLQWGKTLISFAPEINIAEQVTDVKVIGWDPSSKKEIIGKASKGDEEKKQGKSSGSEVASKVYKEEVVEEIRKPVYNQSDADKLAKAALSKLSEGLVKGSGESIGLPILKPGMNIFLGGLGANFSRPYYMEKTTHSIGTSGYKTTFSVRDNAI